MSEINWSDKELLDAYDGTATMVAPLSDPVDENWRAFFRTVLRRRLAGEPENSWFREIAIQRSAIHVEGLPLVSDEDDDEELDDELRELALALRQLLGSVVAETNRLARANPDYASMRKRAALERMRRRFETGANA